MKIKTWLLIAFFTVMILPLIAAYLLFASVNSYNDKQNLVEYAAVTNKLREIKQVLDDPELFHPKTDKHKLTPYVNEELSIMLMNKDGIVLYASDPQQTTDYLISKQMVYEDLYELKQGFRAYHYKQPVFDRNEIIGFYQIVLSRTDWINAVSNRGKITLGIFLLSFVLLYFLVIRLLNRKLNRPLKQLMENMTDFAKGKPFKKKSPRNNELGELEQHFYQMSEQIEASRKEIKQQQSEKAYMIATLSHDLKTPLTSIQAYTEALQKEKLAPEEQKKYQQVILNKSVFMRQMLDDLLMYTLLQSPTYELEFTTVDAEEYFEMLISGYEALCKEKAIRLTTRADVKGEVELDPQQLIRVADNLMMNAVKYAKKASDIHFAVFTNENIPEWLFSFVPRDLFKKEKYIYLVVQNEGIGMSQRDLIFAFEPLYQSDQSRSKQNNQGTGLGLSIAKEIMNRHGGDVFIYAEETKGTTVVCRFLRKKGECI